jgi:hypothetical protein
LGWLGIKTDDGRIVYLLHGTPANPFASTGRAVPTTRIYSEPSRAEDRGWPIWLAAWHSGIPRRR